MTIQLHRLEGFYRVATEGGYTRAARSFPYPITQAAVYQQVRKLEIELGVRLFERVAKDRVAPTRAGQQLYAFCHPFFEALPDVVRTVRSGGALGKLTIDAGDLELRLLLPPWIRRVKQRWPGIRVDLREVQEPTFARLHSGETDLLVEVLDTVPPGYESRRIGVHRAFLVLPGRHPLARRKRVRPTALADEPFVAYPPGTPQHILQLQALARRGLHPSDVTSVSSVDAILAFVASGLGYSVVPWPTPEGPRRQGVAVIRQTGPDTTFPIRAIWRARSEPDPVLEAALDVAPTV